jgi:hypothetical protein
MRMVGHKTESVYRCYVIDDEAILYEAAGIDTDGAPPPIVLGTWSCLFS